MKQHYPRFVSKHLTVKSRSGMEWLCLCPFHEDSNPSFSVNVLKGVYICFACGEKGKLDTLAKKFSVAAPSAGADTTVDEVAQKIEEMSAPSKEAPRIYADYWIARYRISMAYAAKWDERIQLSVRIRDSFALGYDHINDELIIPIFDWDGSANACVRRRLGKFEGPKYLYSKGFKTSQHLYGAYQVRTHYNGRRPKRVAIVEGTIDALALWSVGVPAVALLGANLSVHQKKLLMKLDATEYVIMTDMDTAGHRAAFQVEEALKGHGCLVSRSRWNSQWKDVAEIPPQLRKDIFDATGYPRQVQPLMAAVRQAMADLRSYKVQTNDNHQITYEPLPDDRLTVVTPDGASFVLDKCSDNLDMPSGEFFRHYLPNIEKSWTLKETGLY